jgi:Tol biopolymer transport system component
VCGDVAYPAWSWAGDRIAFVRFDFHAGDLTRSALEVVDVMSGKRTEVYRTSDGLIEYPRWSPDDKRLVFETLTVGASASWLSIVRGRRARSRTGP